MASLATCIRRAGKALDGGDATAIREIFNDYVAADMEAGAAADRAVSDYLGLMDTERNDIVTQLEAAGAAIERPGDVRYARTRPKNQRQVNRLAIMPILDGNQAVDVVGTGEGGKVVMRDLVGALQARQQVLLGDRVLDPTDPADKEMIANVYANEVEAAQKRTGHAGDWYGSVIRNSNAIAALVYEELATDVNAQMAFNVALAITSNQQAVPKNSELAFEIYDEYRRTKRMPENKGWGLGGATMRMQFGRFNELVDKLGLDNTRRFLATEYTAREIQDLTGWKIEGELASTVVHGSAVFGSKIGAGFYQNISGNPDALTIDRWFMRTWGRITGKLLEDPASQGVRTRVTNMRALLRRDRKKTRDLGYTTQALTDDSVLFEAAGRIHRELAVRDFEDATDLERAAKSLDEAVNFPIGVPTNQQRVQIRSTVARSLEILRERGADVKTSTSQALVWFPEKDLYTKHGVGDAKSKPTDYATEFARIATERGVDAGAIGSVLQRETGRRPGRAAPRTEAQVGQPGTLTEAFSPRERRERLARAGTANVRQRERPSYGRRLGKPPRKLVGRPVGIARVYTPEAFARNQWQRAELAAPKVFELSVGEAAVELFLDRLNAAKASSKDGAALILQPLESYSAMRLFLAEDGSAGFALKGDNIVSVFKHSDSQYKSVSQSMVSLAVQEGGRILNAFDTLLPDFYSMQGFKVASRVPWDDDVAPADWDKKHFAKWVGETGNPGEPDLLYMIYDKDNYNPYERGEGALFEDAGGALEHQLTARDGLSPKYSNIRYRLDDDVAENMVDRHPENPLSVMYKFGATVEEQANTAPGDYAGILRRRVDVDPTGKLKEWGLATLPRDGLIDIMPDDRMIAADEALMLNKRMDGRRHELAEGWVTVAEEMNRYVNKSAEGELWGNIAHASTIWGHDPSKAYVSLKPVNKMNALERKEDARRRANYKILQGFWNKLSPEGQALYGKVRDSYAQVRKLLLKGLYDRIDASDAAGSVKRKLKDEIRLKFEAAHVKGPYFPLTRFGKYWAVARDKETGEVIAFSKFEHRPERQQWRAAMQAEGYETDGGADPANNFEQAKSLDPSFVNKVTELVGGIPGGASIADEIHQLYLRSLPEMSLRKQFVHRKGTLGFSNNVVRAFADHTFHAAQQIARLEYQHDIEDKLSDLFQQAKAAEALDDKHSDWAIPLYNEYIARHKNAMDPKRSSWADKATSFGFAWYLGATPAAALLNLFQNPMVAFPVLMGKNPAVASAVELTKTSMLYLGTGGSMANRLRGDDLKAFTEVETEGLFDKTRSHDLGGLTESGSDFFTARANIMKWMSWMFHKTEEMNRMSTFVAAYRLSRKRGESHASAKLEAYKLTQMSHYDYTGAARPRVLQSEFMKVAFLFKNYGANTTYRFGRDIKDAIFNSDLPEARKQEARRRMVGMWMMTATMAGVAGLPFAWLIEDILNLVFGDEDEPYDAGNAFRHYLAEDLDLGPDVATAITRGSWELLSGAGMHERISMSFLGLGREEPKEMTATEHYAFLLEEFAGPIFGVAGGVATGIDDFAQGMPMRGVERVMPKFIRDSVKAYRFMNEGALTYRQTPILPPEAFTTKDIFIQAMGATPSKLSHEYEERGEVRRMSEKIITRRRYLIDQLFLSQRMRDRVALRKWMGKIRDWNKVQPRMRIFPDDIKASAESRRRYDERSISGIALDPRLQYLHREMRLRPGYRGGPGRTARQQAEFNR